jgi:hypothetical protein
MRRHDEDVMAVDAVLWLDIAFIFAFISFGCMLTARRNKPREFTEARLDREFDRAA